MSQVRAKSSKAAEVLPSCLMEELVLSLYRRKEEVKTREFDTLNSPAGSHARD